MTVRLAFLATLLALTLTACAPIVGAVDITWKRLDVTGQGTEVWVAQTNIMDVAVSADGTIAGWWVKVIKGTNLRDTQAYRNARQSNLRREGVEPPPLSLRVDGVLLEPIPETLEQVTSERDIYGGKARSLIIETTFETATGYAVRRSLEVDPRHYTVRVIAEVTPLEDRDAPGVLEILWAGLALNDTIRGVIGRAGAPVADAGHAHLEQPGASLAGLQTGPSGGWSVLMRPLEPAETVSRISPQGIDRAVSVSWPLAPSGTTRFELDLYGGLQELVRMTLEGPPEGLHSTYPGLFQPNIFGTLSLALVAALVFFYGQVGSWGLAIVALTVVVRLALWPLLDTQMRSMVQIQTLKPKVDEINRKYKDQPEKRSQETLKLYQENKINPAAGCLPILLQLPILFILWRVIANFEFGVTGFLWLPDLTLPDPFFVLPVLYVVTLMGQAWISTRNNPQAFRQQVIIQAIFVYIILSFPSGVTLFWVLSTIIGIGQQVIINRGLGLTWSGTSAT